MLGLARIGVGSEAYYLGIVADGVEAPGRWLGGAAPELGLEGQVAPADLARIFEARHPRSGQLLPSGRTSVRAFDLVCGTPKSVSVVWALSGAEAAQEVVGARDAAVTQALGYLERRAVCGYRRHRELVPEVVAAGFGHRTSRAGDPHLHTHLVVANLGRDGTGDWWALDSLVLQAHLGAAGHLFHSHLRYELSHRLGLRFGPVRHGVAQIEGVPEGVLRHFSARRRQVEAVMARHDGHSARSARLAALAERPERRPELAAEALAPEWRRRADEIGFDVARLSRSGPGRGGPGRFPGGRTPGTGVEGALGLTGVSSFSRRDVVEAVASRHPQGLPAAELEAEVDAVLAAPGVVRLAGPVVHRRGDLVRLESGRLLAVGTDRERWTTAAEIDHQAGLSALARAGQGRGPGAVGELPGAGAVVNALLGSGDAVQLVRAGPGPERAQALATCRHAWEAGGWRVLGAAPDERSARELEAVTGLSASPAHQLAAAVEDLRSGGGRPTVVVVTGAEQVGSDVTHRLAEGADRAGWKLVLVADLAEPRREDRAGAWRALEAAVGSLALEPSRTRFGRDAPDGRTGQPALTHPVPTDAVPARPDPVRWDDLVLAATPGRARHELVSDWDRGRRRAGPSVAAWPVMAATRRADVDDLNDRARQLRDGAGELGREVVVVGGLPVRPHDAILVTALGREGRRDGWRLGDTWVVDPAGKLAAGLQSRDAPEPGSGVEFRFAYARTRHQALLSPAPELLVLGEPLPTRPQSPAPPGRSVRHYLVAPGPELTPLLGRLAELEPPAHLVAALGPLPADPAGRRVWRDAAGAVEDHRRRWGVTGPEPLGPGARTPAGPPGRHAEEREVGRRLERAVRHLSGPGGRGRESGPERDPALPSQERGLRTLEPPGPGRR